MHTWFFTFAIWSQNSALSFVLFIPKYNNEAAASINPYFKFTSTFPQCQHCQFHYQICQVNFQIIFKVSVMELLQNFTISYSN